LLGVVVETLRKPSTGLKLSESEVLTAAQDVETLRKPSTGLKHTDGGSDT